MLAAALCCMAITNQRALAQAELKDIIKITQKELHTDYIYEEDRTSISTKLYKGEGIHTGVIVANIEIDADNEDDLEIKKTANQLLEISLSDPYGRIPLLVSNRSNISEITDALKYVDLLHDNLYLGHEVMRGGQYVYRTSIPCLDYLYEKTIDIIDEPTVRMKFGDVKVGNYIQVKAVYNTGYPYDLNQFTGNETATLQLFALGKDEQGNPTETEVAMTQKPLRLYRPDQPLVAAIDALQLNLCNPEPGEYRLKMSSNWNHKNANRDNILIVVSDTLRAQATMQKVSYVAGTDKSLKIHLKMNYGYPYIETSEGDANPTVRIKTSVLVPRGEDDAAESDTLVNMTTPISDAAFADHPLDWENDIEMPALEAQEGAPLTETHMVAEVSVVFNGAEQFKTSIPFDYVPQSSTTAISKMSESNVTSTDTWYDLQGRPATTSTTSGIYIQNHQKKAVR